MVEPSSTRFRRPEEAPKPPFNIIKEDGIMKSDMVYITIIMAAILGFIVGYALSPNMIPATQAAKVAQISPQVSANATNVTILPPATTPHTEAGGGGGTEETEGYEDLGYE